MNPVELLAALGSLVIIDLTLSGDNALVIGLAAHRLPPAQRRLAIVLGGAGAVVLRAALTTATTLLFLIPALKLVGGVLLAWIAFKLLKQEEEAEEGVAAAATLWQAMRTIIAADFIMSLDNVLAIGGAAHGNVPLLVFGLVLSMGLVLFAGSLFAELINRWWWLAYVGAAVICFTAGQMIVEDDLVHAYLEDLPWLLYVGPLALVLVVVPAAHWFHRHRPGKPTPAA
ncbi:MAG TPA: YjbE family putative metal transport protein [Chloroflexota bacterium]|jgi:YjbE family integral membrane protein|nr:YjbE family putative metal transport protein [Chloroflexota bacterium]